MKKGISLIMLLLILGGCYKQQFNLLKVSDEIYRTQIHKFGDNMLLKGLHIYREKSSMLARLKYSAMNDTLFTLEMLGIQGNLYLTYWNKTDTISYINNTDESEYIDSTLYSKYMMKLVSEWNISEIEKEEKINSQLLPNDPIYATRIIIRKNKYKIECIIFSDFYNVERDGPNYQ